MFFWGAKCQVELITYLSGKKKTIFHLCFGDPTSKLLWLLVNDGWISFRIVEGAFICSFSLCLYLFWFILYSLCLFISFILLISTSWGVSGVIVLASYLLCISYKVMVFKMRNVWPYMDKVHLPNMVLTRPQL